MGGAVLTSGVLAFATQIAVFVYMRAAGFSFPIGEVVGLNRSAVGLVVGLIWLVAIAIAIAISSVRNRNRQPEQMLPKATIWWLGLPLALTILAPLPFIVSPNLTGSALRLIGHGGCMPVIVHDTPNVSGYFVQNFTRQDDDATQIGGLKGKLHLMTSQYAYVEHQPRLLAMTNTTPLLFRIPRINVSLVSTGQNGDDLECDR